jgi:hypothetical protein
MAISATREEPRCPTIWNRTDIPGPKLDEADPDVGGSVTIDSSGHLRKIEVDVHVPGTSGGDPAHYEWGDKDPSKPKDLGWTPDIQDTSDPPYDPIPVRPGWHRDPKTGLDSPDFDPTQVGEPGDHSEPGDYPLPNPDERIG